MKNKVIGLIVVVGLLTGAVAGWAQTNLTVIRKSDNSIWKRTCDGLTNCSAWTQIGGLFSVQPTLTWDPSIQKYILIGIGNNQTNIWRTTFDADGKWEGVWVNITGTSGGSPSPVAVTGGGFNTLNPQQIAILRWYGANTAGNSFPVGSGPVGVAFDGASIWVANMNSGTVSKLRASDGANLGTFSAGNEPRGVAFDGVNIWVTNVGSGTVTKLRASDGANVGTFPVGNFPFAVTFDGANIWVTKPGSNLVSKL
jgi:hypothetical protein